jgi:hypothetical protein
MYYFQINICQIGTHSRQQQVMLLLTEGIDSEWLTFRRQDQRSMYQSTVVSANLSCSLRCYIFGVMG